MSTILRLRFPLLHAVELPFSLYDIRSNILSPIGRPKSCNSLSKSGMGAAFFLLSSSRCFLLFSASFYFFMIWRTISLNMNENIERLTSGRCLSGLSKAKSVEP